MCVCVCVCVYVCVCECMCVCVRERGGGREGERERERDSKENLLHFFSLSVPPMFINTLPSSSEGVRGERFKLTCEVSGKPTPTVFWSKTSQPVSELGDPLIQDPGNGSLIFVQLQSNHSGWYFCKIQGETSMMSQTLLTVVNMKDEFMGVGKLEKDSKNYTIVS